MLYISTAKLLSSNLYCFYTIYFNLISYACSPQLINLRNWWSLQSYDQKPKSILLILLIHNAYFPLLKSEDIRGVTVRGFPVLIIFTNNSRDLVCFLWSTKVSHKKRGQSMTPRAHEGRWPHWDSPKINPVLLTFFLCLSSPLMLCKNRKRSEWICFKATSLSLSGFTSYQSSSSAMKRLVSSNIGLISPVINC